MNKNDKIDIGKNVKNFSLKDQDEQSFTISEKKGKKILLSFHPLAWTPVCNDQMHLLEKNQEIFEKLNTIAVGISIDSSFSKKAWANSLNIKNTRLLSDFWPHGMVAEIFGIFRVNDGFSERANIIIDERQKLTYAKVYDIGTLPDFEEIINVLKKM